MKPDTQNPASAEPASPASLPALEALLAVIYREAHCLDTQAFDHWLTLFTDDAIFWMPAWTDTGRLTDNPDQELSLMYSAARAGLADRVWRVRSGLSVASVPLLRTTHSISNPVLIDGTTTEAEVHTSWTCHVWNTKRKSQHVLFGRYEHRLIWHQPHWLIARKKIMLMNDLIPTMIDFYCV